MPVQLYSPLSRVWFLLIAFSFFSSIAMANPQTLPTSLQLHYAVTKNGQPFANVKESYVVTGDAYKIESITKGIGVYALFGERQLTSAGEVTKEGLKPKAFELHQGDNEKKSLLAQFDWAQNKLVMLVKGKEKTAELAFGTQDLASYAYQFMFQPEKIKNTASVQLTTGKKLNTYDYLVTPAALDIAGKTLQTLHLTPVKSATTTETKELWLAAEYHYLPVRILLVDDNGQTLEQTLTEFNAQ